MVLFYFFSEPNAGIISFIQACLSLGAAAQVVNVATLDHKQSYKYMSSDEEGADGFISHPYSWESETWNVKDSLDKKYLETCPAMSRRLVQKRTKGSEKEQPMLEHGEEISWVFKYKIGACKGFG